MAVDATPAKQAPAGLKRARKKPILIEAVVLTNQNVHQVARWCGGRAVMASLVAIEIPTLEGTMRADEGDWVVRGIEGEFYPVKESVFRASYDVVE